MANLATKAPNFTPQNAAEMARRATVSRLAREAREKIEREERERKHAPATDDARRQTTLKQIDAVDRLINDALDDDDADLFLKLTAAKERLWKLVQPTAGVLKSRSIRRESIRLEPVETTQENLQQFKHSAENPSDSAPTSQAA